MGPKLKQWKIINVLLGREANEREKKKKTKQAEMLLADLRGDNTGTRMKAEKAEGVACAKAYKSDRPHVVEEGVGIQD